jgi:sortase B
VIFVAISLILCYYDCSILKGRRIMKKQPLFYVLIAIFIVSLIGFGVNFYTEYSADKVLKEQQEALKNQMTESETKEPVKNEILPKFQILYKGNNDFVGWLTIDDTKIDYPVMQLIEDENYYMSHDYEKKENINGSLVLDSDSVAGVGTKEFDYENGKKSSTNLIIHGHTMKSGEMFGDLSDYENEDYMKEHKIIKFSSLYEEREYEVISVFRSQVYNKSDNVFKFYKFFEAETQEEFDYWYSNIKEMSVFDTGVTAEFGDEFITLTCCAYHVEDGRFVVVAKRVK